MIFFFFFPDWLRFPASFRRVDPLLQAGALAINHLGAQLVEPLFFSRKILVAFKLAQHIHTSPRALPPRRSTVYTLLFSNATLVSHRTSPFLSSAMLILLTRKLTNSMTSGFPSNPGETSHTWMSISLMTRPPAKRRYVTRALISSHPSCIHTFSSLLTNLLALDGASEPEASRR